MKTFLCAICREETHGAYSEGGIQTAICEECYERLYGKKRGEKMEWTEFKKRAETAIQKMKLTERRKDKEFWEGYLQGLRKKYYGRKFKTTRHKSGYAGETVWEAELRLAHTTGYKSGHAGETVWEAGLRLTYIHI